jgi:hypothetical protein
MHTLARTAVVVAATAVAAAAAPRAAAAQGFWTDWTSASAPGATGTATGTLNVTGFGNVEVGYSGQIYFAQTSAATDYWTPRNPTTSPYVRADLGISNPTNTDLIALNTGSQQVKTVTFSAPVLNPLFAIVSLGQSSVQVTYNFDSPFEILSFGPGAFGGPGTLTRIGASTLTGVEGNGVIRFLGTFSQISWTVPTAETWHGFTVGVQGVADEPQQVIPEPSTVALLGAGLAAVGAAARRRRRA